VAHVRIAYTGKEADGERLIAPLRAVGPRLIDQVGELPYTEGGSIYRDPTFPHPYRGANVLLRDLTGAAVRDVLELAGPGADRPCVLDFRHLGGALGRPPAVRNAIGHRDARYLVRAISGPESRDHLRRVLAAAGEAVGVSLNFLYGAAEEAEEAAAFDDGDHQRLVELRRRFDPDGVFRPNHPVSPVSRS
jgi:hypothetical protein